MLELDAFRAHASADRAGGSRSGGDRAGFLPSTTRSWGLEPAGLLVLIVMVVCDVAHAQAGRGLTAPGDTAEHASVVGHRVLVRSEQSLTLSLDAVGHDARTGPSFHRLCATDCVLRLPSGTYRLASKLGAREADWQALEGAVWGDPVVISGPTELRVRHVDNETTRLVGLVVMAASLVIGAAMIGGAVIRGLAEPWTSTDESLAVIMTGAGVGVAGLVVGLSLAFVGDSLGWSSMGGVSAPERSRGS